MDDCQEPLTPEILVRHIQNAFADIDVFIASESNSSPESSWGDVFIYAETHSERAPNPHRFPFATIVVKDYPGFDEFSDLNRPGIFRLNIGVGKNKVCEIFPADTQDAHWDFKCLNTFMPHPVYQNHGWICILNPEINMLEMCLNYLRGAHKKSKKSGLEES